MEDELETEEELRVKNEKKDDEEREEKDQDEKTNLQRRMQRNLTLGKHAKIL